MNKKKLSLFLEVTSEVCSKDVVPALMVGGYILCFGIALGSIVGVISPETTFLNGVKSGLLGGTIGGTGTAAWMVGSAFREKMKNRKYWADCGL